MAVMGNNILDEYMRKTDEYVNVPTTKEKGTVQKQAQAKCCTYIYMDNVDKTKYGSLMNQLRQQYSLGNNQYPMTLSAGNDVLIVHKWDKAYDKRKKKKKDIKKTGEKKTITPIRNKKKSTWQKQRRKKK